MDSTADGRVLLRSRHPLLVVKADDEAHLLTLLRRQAAEAGLPVRTWTAARGWLQLSARRHDPACFVLAACPRPPKASQERRSGQ